MDDLNYLALFCMIAAGICVYEFLSQKSYPLVIKLASALITLFVILLIFFFLYNKTGFPAWMRWPTELFVKKQTNNVFIRPGLYSINTTGWQHNTMQGDDIFTCSECDQIVQVQISYGTEFKNKTNEEFLHELNSEETQKKFSESLLKLSISQYPSLNIMVERVGFSKIGGLDVFEFYGTMETPSLLIHNNSMLAYYKNHTLQITLSYPDGAMNEKSRAAINNLYRSLLFF